MLATKTDPFTLEIIKESLHAIAEEMFILQGRTSKSPIIYEVLDYACGLTDHTAALIAQANGVTGFLGNLTFSVKSVLDKFGLSGLQPGDIIATNDPYLGGGSHLSDVAMAMPVFYNGEIVAFAANKAHWTEIGGMAPGSWTTDSTEVYQEGLQLPAIKIFNAGKIDQAIIDLLAANVRTPDMTLGDLFAQAASLKVAEKRIRELCDKYGIQAFKDSIQELFDQSEQKVRSELLNIPNGEYYAEDYIDGDGMGSGPIRVCVKVTIQDDQCIADFTGTSPQTKGPINCSWTALQSGIRTIFRAITSSQIPTNEGCFRPLQVICPPGTIFTAQRPAPTSAYWESRLFVTDLVWKALSSIIPKRLTAGHFLSVCSEVLVTEHPETKELAILVEPNAGGWGASFDKDGESGLYCIGDGETYIMSTEVMESRYNVLLDCFGFNIEPGGEGEFRGGRGLIRQYRILHDGAAVTASFGRFINGAWGVNGGHKGTPNYVEVVHADDRPSVKNGMFARYPLKKGDIVRLITGTGGGWGNPKNRPKEKVLEDLHSEFITPEIAKEIYGI